MGKIRLCLIFRLDSLNLSTFQEDAKVLRMERKEYRVKDKVLILGKGSEKKRIPC